MSICQGVEVICLNSFLSNNVVNVKSMVKGGIKTWFLYLDFLGRYQRCKSKL